ncbi:hypothetical protein Patl1_23840 [Pistacia atlantica]|uniref:Uncharacterized protein n=1 Tax=Pistacia atlantica TaxID=434234 RepID=A0ACC1A0U2_9ROSI|nr:hypothetical protein Patl1_23840 [Pistacia atlantica]
MRKSCCCSEGFGQRFMAFHVRRPSDIPRGILNMGVRTAHLKNVEVKADEFMATENLQPENNGSLIK